MRSFVGYMGKEGRKTRVCVLIDQEKLGDD